MDAAPFVAVRYHPDVAGEPAATSAPSYDAVERFAYAEHRAASPYTVLELLAPPAGFDAARENLQRWLRTNVLVRDPHPAFYVYEQHELRGSVPAVQRGVLAAVKLAGFDSSEDLLPHEDIDPERARDRLERLEAVPLDVSPAFALADRMGDEVRGLLDRAPSQPPVAALTDEAGVDHRVWRVDDPADVATIQRGLAGATAVIADGHHRYAAALAFRDRQRVRFGPVPDAPWERTLAYIVDSRWHGPRILPIHRLVRGLDTRAEAALSADVHLVATSGGPHELLAALERAPDACFGLWRDGQGAIARLRDVAAIRSRLPAERSERWRELDLAVLEHALFPQLVTGDKVEARSDLDGAAADCDADPTAGLFCLRPVDLATVFDLALAGEPMPAKSTSFRPKPRTGLVMREVAT